MTVTLPHRRRRPEPPPNRRIRQGDNPARCGLLARWRHRRQRERRFNDLLDRLVHLLRVLGGRASLAYFFEREVRDHTGPPWSCPCGRAARDEYRRRLGAS